LTRARQRHAPAGVASGVAPLAPRAAHLRRCVSGVGCLAVLAAVLAAPPALRAHGELLIRIAAVTKQIEHATNDISGRQLAQLHLDRGELYRQDQNWAAAEADYARATQLNPELPVAFYRAKLLTDAGRLEAARALFNQVIARSPTNGEAFLGRARVLAALGRRPEAIADYQRGLELLASPGPEVFLELAQTLKAAGRTGEALDTLDAGLRNAGPVIALQTEALDLETGRKNYDGALTRLDAILVSARRKEAWLARRGEILALAGRPAEARQAWDAALVAIKALPPRLQQNPPMLKLKARIHASLARLASASSPGSADDLVSLR
jgi:tetratricopeptide (TPR) repeat protein